MPTDLAAALARKREAEAQAHTEVTMVSVCLISYLVMLVLLFVEGLSLAE